MINKEKIQYQIERYDFGKIDQLKSDYFYSGRKINKEEDIILYGLILKSNLDPLTNQSSQLISFHIDEYNTIYKPQLIQGREVDIFSDSILPRLIEA